jgi:HD-like signal output (HDOD) protein
MTTATAVASEPQALARDAVRRVSTIATLPEVTARIVATVEDPKSSAAALHKIVAHDPALVTRILKVVNSAFYGLPGQIGSIERAIVMLGLNAVKNIAVAASLGALFRGVKLCDGFTAKDLWTHSIATGIVARELAREMKVLIADEAFLAGMIHDIGLLVALQVWPDNLRRVCETVQQSGADFCATEREICGVDHQLLGTALAETWKFPRSCQLVTGYHHRPLELAADTRLLVTLVYTADTLCAQHKQGFNLTALHQKLEDAGLSDVKLEFDLVQRISSKLEDLVRSSATMFG